MPDICARLDDEMICVTVDLTVFDDPRQGEVDEAPGAAPGALEVTGAPEVRTRLARGAVPDAWPRDERLPGELVKGQERVPCEIIVRSAAEGDGGAELALMGDEVFRAVMGRAP